ncbi:hypothetical protein [Corynebacterium ulceribovis]|nr:hypothetical protein [Corynebacterium ulceribovis]
MTTIVRRFCVALFVFALVVGVLSVAGPLPAALAQDADDAIADVVPAP